MKRSNSMNKKISSKIKLVSAILVLNVAISGVVMLAKYSDNIAIDMFNNMQESDDYLWNNQDYTSKETEERISNSLLIENEKSAYIDEEPNSTISSSNNPLKETTAQQITTGEKNLKDKMTLISVISILITVALLMIVDTIRKHEEKVRYKF